MSEQDQYKAARTRARELAAFYKRLVLYIVGIPALAALDFITSPGDWWFHWAALGFGIMLARHAWCVFGENFFDKNWEERKAAELLGQKPKHKNREDYFEESALE